MVYGIVLAQIYDNNGFAVFFVLLFMRQILFGMGRSRCFYDAENSLAVSFATTSVSFVTASGQGYFIAWMLSIVLHQKNE